MIRSAPEALDQALRDIGKEHEDAANALLVDPMPVRVNGAAIRALFAAYRKSHSHPGAFACCSAHAVADTLPDLLAERADLLAEVARLTAENHELTASLAVPGSGDQA